MNGTVNVIGVDVAVSDFGATLDKSNPGMLEWLQICVPVQIGLVEEWMRLLVGKMLLGFCEFTQETKFGWQVTH